MVSLDDSLTPSFYFYLYIVREIRVLFPFFPFEEEVLKVLSVSPSQITPNGRTLVRSFEFICRRLEAHLTT